MPNTIAENLQRLVDAKDDIAEAITAKGGTVASGDGLEEFAADIATIPSGSGADAESYLMTIESSGFADTSYIYIVNTTNETFVYGLIGATELRTTSTLTLTYPSTFTPIATRLNNGFMYYNRDSSTQYNLLSTSDVTIIMNTTNHTLTIAFKSGRYFKTGTNLICMVFSV